MDPITWTIILCLAAAAVGQRIYTDGVAKLKGKPLPSLEARARRQELAQQQALTTGAPGIWQALADRAASRIASPPPRARWRAELASYLDDVASDFVINLHARHDEKQQERAKARGEQAPPASERLQHVLEILDAEVFDEHNPAATPPPQAPASSAGPTPAAGDPDRGPARLGSCRHRLYPFDPPCDACVPELDELGEQGQHTPEHATAPTDPTPDLEPAPAEVPVLDQPETAETSAPAPAEVPAPPPDEDYIEATPAELYRCGGGCGIELVEHLGQYGPDCAARDAEDYPPDTRRDADDELDDELVATDRARQLPAVVDGEVVPAHTPEPATSPGSTTEGTTMSEPTVIDGDVHDPSHAHAHATACATFVTDLGQQAEICANNMAGLGVGPRAVGEIRGMHDDAAEFLAAADGAATVFADHMNRQNNIADNEDLARTVDGTYFAGDRRA